MMVLGTYVTGALDHPLFQIGKVTESGSVFFLNPLSKRGYLAFY